MYIAKKKEFRVIKFFYGKVLIADFGGIFHSGNSCNCQKRENLSDSLKFCNFEITPKITPKISP